MMKRAIIIIGIFISLRAVAAGTDPQLTEAYKYYKKGDYPQAIRASSSIPDPDDPAGIAFFQGTAYSKMQDFPQAARAFLLAEKLRSPEKSVHYDRGQALYACQKLEEARDEFIGSMKAKYKIGASAYYVGFIYQTLENYEMAKTYYKKIQELKSDPDQVKQPALFQMAEIQFLLSEKITDVEKRRLHLLDHVLPAYEEAESYESGTETALTAASRIAEVDKKIDDSLPRMKNGIPLPRRAYSLHLSQSLEYNSNVTYQADAALLQISNKDSLVETTTLLSRYQWNFAERWSVLPEVFLSAGFYSRQNTGSVYENDNVLMLPAIRSRYEHTVAQHPASVLFDVEYSYTLRDYAMEHRLPYYSRYTNFVIGERAKILETGATTLKFNVKFDENENPDYNDIDPQVSLDQVVHVFGKYDLDSTLTFDYKRSRNSYYDERNYTLRESVALPKFFANKIDFTPTLYLAAKDPMNQRYLRGTELDVNPSLSLSDPLSKKWTLDFTYSFTRNLSKSVDSYEYSQHDAKFTLNYSL